ncbi:hypothetical protein ACUXAV_000345 [Cupriavidus metallidurans]|uniref:hypothetical protein n=1 Tax=Cupriavidus metallidurans TaxID=119219 RepID=UPI0004937A50|nr:hypothetical protein [Cupriavidus metallidurans]MDE4918305.1 hypothetical protein [Cupriavidus metallidurans]
MLINAAAGRTGGCEMDQVRLREAIREEGVRAARDGKPISECRYEEGTDARDEWEKGYGGDAQ